MNAVEFEQAVETYKRTMRERNSVLIAFEDAVQILLNREGDESNEYLAEIERARMQLNALKDLRFVTPTRKVDLVAIDSSLAVKTCDVHNSRRLKNSKLMLEERMKGANQDKLNRFNVLLQEIPEKRLHDSAIKSYVMTDNADDFNTMFKNLSASVLDRDYLWDSAPSDQTDKILNWALTFNKICAVRAALDVSQPASE